MTSVEIEVLKIRGEEVSLKIQDQDVIVLAHPGDTLTVEGDGMFKLTKGWWGWKGL